MKNYKGIITADVVGSTKLPIEKRDLLPESLKKLVDELQVISPMCLEIYRGDSFQIVVESYEKTLLIATLLRLGLKKKEFAPKLHLDARMSIGIGTVGYESQTVGQSDGEAFVLSGRAFETIGKRRLIANIGNPAVNAELQILSLVLDELLTDNSPRQSALTFEYITHPDFSQKELAGCLGVKPPVISKTLRAAKAKVISSVLTRIETILKSIDL